MSIPVTAGLKDGDVLLDAGCGDGFFSIAASSVVGNTGKVYAFDVDRKSITALEKDIAEKCISNITAKITDVTGQLPLDDETVDFVLISNVLHGFVENGEDHQVLNELARVMKHDGTLLVVEFKKKHDLFGPPFRVRLSGGEIKNTVSPFGFVYTNEFDTGHHHRVFMYKKA
jgi:ubiquinone/menaquinone biosynthesis C-methylase UbiE